MYIRLFIYVFIYIKRPEIYIHAERNIYISTNLEPQTEHRRAQQHIYKNMKEYTETYIYEYMYMLSGSHINRAQKHMNKYTKEYTETCIYEKICIYINRDLRPAYMRRDVYKKDVDT